jgi:hypothetical protein
MSWQHRGRPVILAIPLGFGTHAVEPFVNASSSGPPEAPGHTRVPTNPVFTCKSALQCSAFPECGVEGVFEAGEGDEVAPCGAFDEGADGLGADVGGGAEVAEASVADGGVESA